PQRDRLIFAVDASLGVNSIDQVLARRPPLRIATGPNDGVNFVGLAAHTLLDAVGLSRATVESWGGEFLEDERPFPCIQWLAEGRANAIVQEAIMMPQWQRTAEARPLTFLPVPGQVLADLEAAFGWPRAAMPAGYFPGQSEGFETLDFSDFLALCRSDMPDDVAHLLAWCMGETRAALEAQYRHMPPDHSPVTYPLDPTQMGRTAVPLHPGAARYYQQLRPGEPAQQESRALIWA
ncbi:MAG: TAXI family TRAP transporter solute-binding subunit, partial [Chloroflexota bacterium]